MLKNMNFPQFGIVTSISASERSAKVYLPMYKIETGYIKISREIPIYDIDNYGIAEKSQVVVSFINGDTANGIITSWI